MMEGTGDAGEPVRRLHAPEELAFRYGEPAATGEALGRRSGHDKGAAERGISPVGGRFGGSAAGKLIGMAAMLGAAGLLILAGWDRGDAKPAAQQSQQTPARQVVDYEGPRAATPLLAQAAADPNAPRLNPPAAAEALDAQGGHVPARRAEPATGSAQAADPRLILAEAARRAPILAYSANRGVAGFSGYAATVGGAASEGTPSELDALRRGAAVGQARAQMLPDRNFLITAGAVLPCVLQTALESSVPGYATCLIPRDIYSDNGQVVLMERGTKVLGEYRAGMRQGQKRLFVLWTRAVTPRGVSITLASPAADGLGRAGFDGRVDTLFWERFGGALLLSIVDDAANIAAQSAGRGRFNTTTNLPSETADIALQNSIHLPPVLRKNQGEEVSIFVAQDLNFADVYGLALR